MWPVQVLLPPGEGLLGSVVRARITSASRWSVVGEVLPEAGAAASAAPQLPLGARQTASPAGEGGELPASAAPQWHSPESPLGGQQNALPAGEGRTPAVAPAVAPTASVPTGACGVSCACVADESEAASALAGQQQHSKPPEPLAAPAESVASADGYGSVSGTAAEALSGSSAQSAEREQAQSCDAGPALQAASAAASTRAAGGRSAEREAPAVSSSRGAAPEASAAPPRLPARVEESGRAAAKPLPRPSASQLKRTVAEPASSGVGLAAAVGRVGSVGVVDSLLMVGVLLGLSGALVAGLMHLFDA